MFSFVSATIDDNLIQYYTLDESSGTIYDSIGNLNSSIETGVTYSQSGMDGSSVTLAGGNSDIIGFQGVLISKYSNSMNVWIKAKDTSERGIAFYIGDSSSGYGVGIGATTFTSDGNDLIAIYQNVAYMDTNAA